MRIRTLAALGSTAVALTIALAAPAIADPTADPGTDTTERGEKVCKRLPQIEARADKVLARLQGDENTKGSVAYTKKRAERARAAGNTDVATALDSRAKARQDLITVLLKKQEGLPKAKQWCAEHGFTQ
jgi:hypothetical protein